MLVLSRKVNQQIRIGEDVVITIVRFRAGSVGIGIEAPKNIRVLRGELLKETASNVATVEAKDENLVAVANAAVGIQAAEYKIFAPLELNSEPATQGEPNDAELASVPGADLHSWRMGRRQVRPDTAVRARAKSAALPKCCVDAGAH